MLSGRAVALAAVLLVGCGGDAEPPAVTAPSTLPLRGPFEEGQPIPSKHTCDGEDVSPMLVWSVPAAVDEWAVTMVDLDADFVHWVAYALPADTPSILEGDLPAAAREGPNDFGRAGYSGPCPPLGDPPHRYEFRVYALDRPVSGGLPEEASYDDVLRAIECCVSVFGRLTGTYGR